MRAQISLLPSPDWRTYLIESVRTILITGGTGFVGPYLIDLLKSDVTRIVVLSSKGPPVTGRALEYRTVDLRNAQQVQDVVRDILPDEIYHLAGIAAVNTSWENPRLTFEVNVAATFNLLDTAMSLASPPRILLVSTAQVYAPATARLTEDCPIAPDNPYAASKAMAELLTAPYRHSLKGGVVIARAFNHTGPGQSLNFVLPALARQFVQIRAGLKPPTIVVGNTEVKRDFSDVRDVVRAYRMLLAGGTLGQTYNVCSGAATRLADIIHELETLTGVKVTLEIDPARVRLNDVPQLCGDPGKLHRATGYTPQFSLKDTLQTLLENCSTSC